MWPGKTDCCYLLYPRSTLASFVSCHKLHQPPLTSKLPGLVCISVIRLATSVIPYVCKLYLDISISVFLCHDDDLKAPGVG